MAELSYLPKTTLIQGFLLQAQGTLDDSEGNIDVRLRKDTPDTLGERGFVEFQTHAVSKKPNGSARAELSILVQDRDV